MMQKFENRDRAPSRGPQYTPVRVSQFVSHTAHRTGARGVLAMSNVYLRPAPLFTMTITTIHDDNRDRESRG